MSARAIGSASIAFGLVNIPVKVYSSTDSGSDIRFHYIHPDTGARVRQQLVDGSTGEVVERKDLVKGYEVADDQYVLFTKDELKEAEVEASQSIEIGEFVPIDSVDPIYWDTPYYLGPGKGGSRAYALLREALKDSGLGAIGQYAARGQQQIVMLRADDTGIVMQRLHYADEVRPWDDIPLGDDVTLKAQEKKLAGQIVQMGTEEAFDPTRYNDTVHDRLVEMIEAKKAGTVVDSPSASPKSGQVIDLMEALKKSLDKKKTKPTKKKAS